MNDPNQGKTLWQMLTHKNGGNGHPAGVQFNNPLDLRIGWPLLVSKLNGEEYEHASLTVVEIQQYIREIGQKRFVFTDYLLRKTDPANPTAPPVFPLRLRLMPNPDN